MEHPSLAELLPNGIWNESDKEPRPFGLSHHGLENAREKTLGRFRPFWQSAGILAWVALTLPTASRLSADCPACGPEPRICVVQIGILREGERRPRLLGNRELVRLAPGEKITLELEALDQYGRTFPANRSGFEATFDRRCPRSLLRLRELDANRFEVESDRERGKCELLVWVPGNLNLEWSVPIEVRGLALTGYSLSQSEALATRLYRALLGREPDPEGLTAATREIQRGRLLQQIRAMAGSAEFAQARSRLSASQLLDQIYRGLLGREPDSSGVRTYLGQVERGEIAEVVFSIVRSEEFEERALLGP